MLTLILGRGKSGKTTKLLQAVRDCTATGMAQRVVLVPEQLSHQMERRLGEVCGDTISYTAEVLSFTRLAGRVESISGGGARKSLDQAGRILTARLALMSIQSQLRVFAAAAMKMDFLPDMIQMIDELKNYQVTASLLSEASKGSEGVLAQKLLELSLIMGAYDAVMAQGTCDPRDRLVLLKDRLLQGEYACERHFFVDGFTDFSAQELEILKVLLSRGKHLTVTVLCDLDSPDQQLFTPGRETLAQLLSMAKGEPVEILHADYRRPLVPELSHLEQSLFAYAAPSFDGECSSIRVVSAADLLEECRNCAAVLRQHAMAGMRWRDMAVAVGDTGVYGPMLEAVCRELDIPLYTGIKTPLAANATVAFILCALEAATEGMDIPAVTAYLKTGYSGLTDDECDSLENYIYTWGIRGRRWHTPWTDQPDGGHAGTKGDLTEINTLRERAGGPLLRLSNGLKSAGNLRGQMEALYRFLEETDLFEQVNRKIARLTGDGDHEQAQIEAQVWNALMENMQQTVSVLGETAQSSGEFYKLVRLGFSQYAISTIPSTLDAVTLGGIDAMRGMEPRLLFVLGVNEGVLPTAKAGTGLLSEREREILLNEMQIQLSPGDESLLERQFLTIYSALTAAGEELYLSYSASDNGSSLSPSFLIGRLRRLFPDLYIEQISGIPAMTPSALAEQYFEAGESGLSALELSIRRTAQELPALEQLIVDAKAASLPREEKISSRLSGLLFGTPVVMTATRLDKLGECPLSFFLNFGLKARPRKEATFDAAAFGDFLHYIMEKSLKELNETRRAFPLTHEESGALVNAYMDVYAQERLSSEMTARQAYIYRRNGNEVEALLTEITEELSASDFRPCGFELRFGKGEPLGSLEVSGKLGNGRLDGVIDRVDLWKGPDGDYVRVIDYKSGSKKFDFTDLYGGVSMQLLLYLFALKHTGIPGVTEAPMPAGALYFPAKRPILSAKEAGMSEQEIEKERKKSAGARTGLLLSDGRVLEAMEHGITGKYLPITRKKDSYSGDALITPKQMEQLQAFINRRMAEAVDTVCGGDFQPKPFYRGAGSDPCSRCDYCDVCQKDQRFKLTHYRPKIKAEEFWRRIGGDTNG